MELVSHTMPVQSRQSDEVLVMPIGDIQWAGDHKEVAIKMLKKHIAWGVEKGAYFLGMGDYIDTFSPSNRARLRSANLYDTAMKATDKMASDLVEELYEEALAPSRGRWLGMLEGHHFHEFRDGTTSDQKLTNMLQGNFLGTSAYVQLKFMMGGGKKSGAVTIWCHHGSGGGTTIGAHLNKLERLTAKWHADIYLMGHVPSKANAPVDYIVPVFPPRGGKPMLIHRTLVLAGTGGFMRSYVEGARAGDIPRGNYAEQGMMPPAALGGVLVKVRPRWKDIEGVGEIWMPDLSVEA